MKSQEPDVLHVDSLNPQPTQTRSLIVAIADFAGKTLTIAELEARKLHHDSTELVTRAVQPAL